MAERIRVLKFGGASLADPARIGRAVELIERERSLAPVVVVVSAMAKTTDDLLAAAAAAAAGDEATVAARTQALAEATRAHAADAWPRAADTIAALEAELHDLLVGVRLLREHSPASLDLILSFGERISAEVVAARLAHAGVPSQAVDARDLVHTDDRFGDALVDWGQTAPAIQAALHDTAFVPVVTGFLGRAPDGRTTTLGRNGSDYTATLLARALAADEVQIWRGLAGVYTADPALVREAWPLANMSFGEALELATFGARMFHPRTMIPLIESGIPLRLRDMGAPDEPGTRVDASGADDVDRATSVTSLEQQALLDVQVRQLNQATQLGERVHAALADAGVTTWMATQSAMGQALSAVVPAAEAEVARTAIEAALAPELARGDVLPVGVQTPVTLLTLVCEAMGRTPNVAGRLFATLGELGVNVLAIGQSASSRSVSCVIPAAETPGAVRAVHAAFNLSFQHVSLLVVGAGTVGSELLTQIREQAHALTERQGLMPVVAGITTRHRRLWAPDGVALATWRDDLAAAPQTEGPALDTDLLDRLAKLPSPVLVDVTASDGMEAVYAEAFARGIHVVAANKKPLALPQDARDDLLAAARRHHRGYRYETTVGASLPVIETLQDLVQTGDRVRRIEGSLSGTLGYLALALSEGVPLHEAVRTAKDLGFTEPFPGDDLSGLDAARKALILARELGLRLDLDDVALTPLVPSALLAPTDLDTFFDRLAGHAPAMAAEVDALAAQGQVLRYLVTIDPSAAERGEAILSVGPVGVTPDHPAARLQGSAAFVAFHTDRYAAHPLVVQGAGAGGAVTAAGVLADVLRLFARLRGQAASRP